MFAFVFTTGTFAALALMWWHLQRAVTCADADGRVWCRHPRSWRAALAAMLLLLSYGPRGWFMLRGDPMGNGSLLMELCFVWMVMVLWFCTAALCVDVWNGFALLCQFAQRKLFRRTSRCPLISPRHAACAAAAFTAVALVCGLCGVRHPRVVHREIASAAVPASADGYRLMLLSDLHFRQQRYPAAILDAVEAALQSEKPDLLVHAGDFVDGPWSGDISPLVERVRRWTLPDGKFAVLGNHDAYAGRLASVRWHEQAGLRLLGQSVEKCSARPNAWLFLGGADDEAVWRLDRALLRQRAVREGGESMPQHEIRRIVEELPEVPESCFGLLLRHQPLVPRKLPAGYAAMVSGHTHGGQVFPFNFVVYATYGLRTGVPQWSRNLWIYICRGTGFWGPPLRFLEPPEITVITFRHQSSSN